MICVSCITFKINTFENPRLNHVSISKAKRSKIWNRTNIATKGSTILRKMKKIFYHEKYVKIKKAFYELLEEIEEVSRKPRNVKDQSSNTFDKIICSNKTSMISFDDKEARSSWLNSSIFCNSTFIIVCCSISTNFNYCIKRCCLTTSICCFTMIV